MVEMQKKPRGRVTSLIATVTAALVVASGLGFAPAVANAEEPVVPTVTVSQTMNLEDAGQTVTVEGSGFLPSAPSTTGTRPPLAGKFTGVYVAFGYFAEVWQPTANAPATARKTFDTKWAVNAEDMTTIGGVNAGAIEVKPDGTFSTQLWVSEEDVSALASGGRFGVYTYPGGGAKYAPFETYTPMTFAQPPVAPGVAASVTEATADGIKVKTDLSNIVSTTGAYVSVIEAGTSGELTQDNMGLAVDWVTPARFTDGAATSTLSVPKAKLDRTKQYEVVAWKGHTLPTSETIYGTAPAAVTEAQWNTVFPAAPSVTTTTKLTASPVSTPTKHLPNDTEVTLTAQVTPSNVGGTVVFFDNGKAIGSAQQVKSGKASIKVKGFSVDGPMQSTSHTLKAVFTPTGSGVLGSESAPVILTVFADDTVVPPMPKIVFTDVKKGDKFYKEISWMASSGLSTGTKQANGTYKYFPADSVSREAMAAFLYREAKASYKGPKVSPFADVKPGDKFYNEITWMYKQGISTGTKQPSGKPLYKAKDGISREAMAAFMYRIDTKAKTKAPAVSPFADVKKSDKFYKEIAWMYSTKLSTGTKQASGKPRYEPKSNVSRAAMAAFLYRKAH